MAEKGGMTDDVASQLSPRKSNQTIKSADDKSYTRKHQVQTPSVKYEFTKRQKEDLKTAFDLFDLQGTGRIEVKDLKVAFRALGFQPTKRDLQILIAEVDKDNTGKLSFSDFLYLMHKKMFEKDTKVDLMKSFRLMDEDKTGKISLQNLQQVAIHLDEEIGEEELNEMIQLADLDGDGEIGPSDFIAIMTKFYDRSL